MWIRMIKEKEVKNDLRKIPFTGIKNVLKATGKTYYKKQRR